jgi:ankyrin repeat protein
MLLDFGADPNTANDDGGTPFSIAKYNGHIEIAKLLLDPIYNDIADKVLVAISKQDLIFDTAFIIFKKTVKETITIEEFNIDDTDTHNKLYNIFQAKFSKV